MKIINKSELRIEYKQKRKDMPMDDVASKSKNAQNILLKSDIYKNAKTIMIYMPLGNETDTSLVINNSFDSGKNVVIPVTDGTTGVITPCYISKDTQYKTGSFNIKEPTTLNVADVCDIDVIVVPGIAFTKGGERVGFGKGCYDMLLKNYDGIKIGFCYDLQLCDGGFSDKHDIMMDYIITDTNIIKCKTE